MIETEAKIKINQQDFERISKLVEIPDYISQENKFCSLDSGILRIRFEGGKNIFAFKGMDNGKRFNSREEIEIEFDNRENLEYILKILGYSFDFCYGKYRASFELVNCIVCVDKLSNGDLYIEIEGEENDILKVIDFLGLKENKIERKSYFEILGGKDGLH